MCSGLAGIGADGGGLWLLAFGSFATLVGASAVFIAGSFLLFSVVGGGWAFSFTTWNSFQQALTISADIQNLKTILLNCFLRIEKFYLNFYLFFFFLLKIIEYFWISDVIGLI